MKRAPRSSVKSPRRAARANSRPAPIPIESGVRASRVANAQARIAVDYYDRGDVRDRLVETLIAELARR